MRKRKPPSEIAMLRDEALDVIERAEESMTLLQAKEFLADMLDDVRQLLANVEDAIASARADTLCTCGERGRRSLHTKACAKTKAVK